MKDSSLQPESDRLKDLKKENEELKKILQAREIKEEEMQSYRIFYDARKKFMAWIGVILFIITAFGVISVASIIHNVKTEIEKRLENGIIEEIKGDFKERHEAEIVEDIKTSLTLNIQSEAEEAMREERKDFLANLKTAQVKSPSAEQRSFVKAYEKSFGEERYFVIAGSSPRRGDLESELQRVRKEIGDEFNKKFPNAGIYPPAKGNKNFALVLGTSLPYDEAKTLQKDAITMGFRQDTFLWKASRAFFSSE